MGGPVLVGGVPFDSASGRLGLPGGEVRLRPKTAAVLAHLVTRAGEVVTKGDLLRAVWAPDRVTEAALAVCVNELRQAFGDRRGDARVIATVHGRGYRLVAEVEPSSSAGGPVFVGRTAELALLRAWHERADTGRRTVGFVAAPAGVGKSALVGAFLDRLPGTLVARARCADDLATREPYRPLLDALAGLCHDPLLRQALARCAPHWLLRLPALLDDREVAALRARAGGQGAERMQRELADALAMLTADRTLVLVLEDLHAADRATAEWVRYLTFRREPARLLVIGTYRPADAIAGDRPLRPVVRDLRARRRCEHLALRPLARADVDAYLSRRLAPRRPSPALVAGLWERTEGHALFLVAMTGFLIERGLLENTPEGVTPRQPLAELGLPHQARQMLEQSLDLLEPRDRRLLDVAAVIGSVWAAEALHAGWAALEEVSRTEVEERCARIARQHPALTPIGEREWPDGTVSASFTFAHDEYWALFHERLDPGRQTLVHRAVAERLAAAWAVRPGEVEIEIASHFERGGEPGAAARHLAIGAETALALAAYPEAIDHARHGLQLLERSPDADSGVELRLRRAEVVARSALWGWRDQESREACRRLRDLAAAAGDTGAWLAALLGLYNQARAAGDTAAMLRGVREIEELAHRTGDRRAVLVEHFFRMATDSGAGQCAATLERAEALLRLYLPAEHADLALLIGEQLDLAPHLYAAIALWQLGCADRALDHLTEALRLARRGDSPAGLARALWWAATLHLACRDTARLEPVLDELDAICRRHDLRIWMTSAAVFRGCLLAWRGEADAGLQLIRQASAVWDDLVAMPGTYLRSLRARVCLAAGLREEGLQCIEAALRVQQHTGPGRDDPELLRLRGDLLLLGGPGAEAAAERDLRGALALARERQAKAYELRAATSLARLLSETGRNDEGRELLAGVAGWFTEGEDTGDVRDARALLRRLSLRSMAGERDSA